MKKIIFMLAGLGIVAAVGYAMWMHTHATPEIAPSPATPSPSVSNDTLHYPAGAPQLAYLKIQPVHAEPVPLFAPVTARLAYDENHTYRAYSPVSGRVVAIMVSPGDRVALGQPLARIESPDFGTAVAENQKARVDLQAKQAAQQRAKQLFDAGVLARKDLEGANSDLAMSQAEAQRTSAHLRGLGESSGEGYVLRSRVAGIVAERQISQGLEVMPGAATPLFVVTDPSRLWLTIDVTEQNIGRIHRGQKLAVRVDAYPNQTFTAEVKQVGVALDAGTRRLPVTAEVTNANGQLHPEMYAQVAPMDETKTLQVRLPNTALFTKGLYSFIWVETQPGTLQRRRVTPLLQLPDTTYVSDGVADGERVVTTGALLLESDASGS